MQVAISYKYAQSKGKNFMHAILGYWTRDYMGNARSRSHFIQQWQLGRYGLLISQKDLITIHNKHAKEE